MVCPHSIRINKTKDWDLVQNAASVGDKVKLYIKCNGNYTSRKETVSRWSPLTYEVTKIAYGTTVYKIYDLQCLTRTYTRHEILLVD